MVFSIPSYLCTGDRPQKQHVDPRVKGATFYVSRPKTGHNPDALFDKHFLYMWNGERGADLETMRRKEQLESKKKFITPTGFLPTGPSPKPSGLGSYFGTFQQKPPIYAPPNPEKHEQRIAKKELAPRGIYTAPIRKTPAELCGEYIANIYDQPRINDREARKTWRQRMPAEPFRPGGRLGYTFDESMATGHSKCYIMTVPFKEKKPEPVFSHFRIAAPWRPAGYVDDSPAHMEYWEDPYGGYDPRLDPKSYVKKPSDNVFKPSSAPDDFWYTQSVAFKRI
ncbi:hypothetical protein AGDE_05164 [Angomonas deanei]|uniref:Uncharacterized protein n=1 Tax=Angomonas deanei TaxID=59799 RepID=S9VA30_9TRYP|nr:hypothetical protein AGDE_06271 [Angomonas deanei]EPY38765.1 hypothetical protein AGDE_05164 [Angomonas deanei]CAD2218831.1 Domain of unknown function (DUF4586), putative [Angomonas deanei]|eukprot:EPY37663.1 hypothetical protein AGDE_06271 [Angomonas deanei]